MKMRVVYYRVLVSYDFPYILYTGIFFRLRVSEHRKKYIYKYIFTQEKRFFFFFLSNYCPFSCNTATAIIV